MDWQTFLKITHIIGTVIGVGATTFVEIFYIKFAKDGQIDPLEHDVLKIFYQLIRLGLVILVFSGLGYFILWRLNFLGPQVFFSDRFLAKMTVVVVLLGAAFAINFRLVNLKVGSAVTFVSWYAALVLGAWRKMTFSYPVIMLGYIISIVIAYFILELIRNKASSKRQ